MQNLQKNVTTLFDPNFESQDELYRFSERLIEGLPGRHGNTLLLLRIGVTTPSAGIALPRRLRERMNVQLHFDMVPDKDFVRHVRPGADVQKTAANPQSDAGGPVYRLRIHELPVPQKHVVADRLGLLRSRGNTG